ncbi:pyruvate, water dikinase regulatory protein [Methylophaga lonarensis]|uniref:pyruvate, water dikinase regulatory protein n=1 Tax=Methylophaga lonarensis TaxID=999151 RepID=UPI003D2CD814
MSDISENTSNEVRNVFFVSDETGLTAESYGKCLLAQFPNIEFETVTLSFIDTPEKVEDARDQINAVSAKSKYQPLIFSTLVQDESQYILESCDGYVISLFHGFIGAMENFFGMESSRKGVSRITISDTTYQRRLDAIDYSLTHDDGVRPDQYEEADVILAGVSRCGKTPTSLYLAMNFSLKVANYPLTPEDFEAEQLPEYLRIHQHKLAGLTIKPVPLSRIRRQRRPDSDYSSLEICQAELSKAMAMFEKVNIPVFDTTNTSIEEISSRVVRSLGLARERIRESTITFNNFKKPR